MRRDPIYILLVVIVTAVALHLMNVLALGTTWPVVAVAAVICLIWALP